VIESLVYAATDGRVRGRTKAAFANEELEALRHPVGRATFDDERLELVRGAGTGSPQRTHFKSSDEASMG